MKVSSTLAALLLGLPLLAAAEVPPAGLRAEGEGRWDEALQIYRQALDRDPAQADLWQRVADIRARLGDPQGAAAALEAAVRHAPADAGLFFRLSQAHASAQQAKPALEAINRALALAPRNLEYLTARAELASWNQDYATALASWQAILAFAPERGDARLGIARNRLWQGDVAGAAEEFRAYLAQHPDDRSALLEYLEAEAAQGNLDTVTLLVESRRPELAGERDFWLRLADIYAAGGRPRAAADALATAAAAGSPDATLHLRAAQTYAEAEDVPAALAAIERALALEPDNAEFLQTRAELAAWAADYPLALASHERILARNPGDPGALLGIARVSAWQGETDRSARFYRAYLAAQPDVQLPWIEYIEVEAERGDHARAMELLETYRRRFGDNQPYLKQKVRVLAWAERPTPALGLVAQLLPELPDDYDLHYTHTVALLADHRPVEAAASLGELARLRPLAKETHDISRVVHTPLRSSVSLLGGYRTDSDDVDIRQLGAEGAWAVTPNTRLIAGGDRQWLEAPLGSGLEHRDGSEDAAYSRAWLGASRLMSSRWSVDARAGSGSADGDERFIYRLGADLWPRDGLALRLEREQDLYAVSPRAVSLGIERRANRIAATWAPDLRHTVELAASLDSFSDGNDRWEAEVAPRRAVWRSQRVNLDLGVAGRWFGFDKDPDNGYYAPRSYQRYALTAFGYWKISDDDGVSVVLSAGAHKDNTMDSFRFGGDLLVEGFFGLYRDWMLNVRAGLTQNARDASGAFHSRLLELVLTRRF